jgi:hypothetical protein
MPAIQKCRSFNGIKTFGNNFIRSISQLFIYKIDIRHLIEKICFLNFVNNFFTSSVHHILIKIYILISFYYQSVGHLMLNVGHLMGFSDMCRSFNGKCRSFNAQRSLF